MKRLRHAPRDVHAGKEHEHRDGADRRRHPEEVRQGASDQCSNCVAGVNERIEARGGEFTMPPTEVTGSTIAMVNDTCGNLVQLTQLSWQERE